MSYLREQYAALDLQVLERVIISDKNWVVLEKGLNGFGEEDVEDNLPITIARFQNEPARIIMDWAHDQKDVRQNISPKILPAVIQWQEDIVGLDRVFFGEGHSYFSSSAIGPFNGKRALAPALHMDGGHKARVYTCRLGGLPTHVIRQADINALPVSRHAAIQSLIQSAMGKGNRRNGQDIEARQALIDQDILQPLPIGDVGLLSGETKHCSSSMGRHDVPVYSAFLRHIRMSP